MSGIRVPTSVLLPLLFILGLSTSCRRSSEPEPVSRAEAVSEPVQLPQPVRHFVLPTPNRAVLDPGAEEQAFVGTVGRTWVSGTFGCVRSEGWQIHEGLDIRSIERDKRGEPTDPVYATADGAVAYVNSRAGLSNYGIYVILQHKIQGWEIYSLYAHLASVAEGIEPGQTVRAGDVLGIMGRTTNTRQPISRERAHLHFELLLMLNDRFQAWHENRYPGQRNHHDLWNGRNFVGIDPLRVLLEQDQNPAGFDLGTLIREQTTLCRVLVRETRFSWLDRYPQLIEHNPIATEEGIAAYEVHLNFNGLPFRLVPRAASELRGRARFEVLEVNESEYRENPCRRLVRRRGPWELAPAGELRLDLLTY